MSESTTGNGAAPPGWLAILTARAERHVLARWLFLRLLGLCYLIAFASLWSQLDGLVGARGIQPAGEWLRAVDSQIGVERWWKAPTLCWLNFSDGFRQLLCAAGVASSLLVVIGVAQRFALVSLWVLYLSLSTVTGIFLGYQWDTLLLEAGFLGLLVAPGQWRPRRASREDAPARLAVWLVWWLVFRLMFMAGAVKLLSNDPAWWDLSALTVHYETQCIPARLGWWAHQLPGWLQAVSCGSMFLIELVAPFLIVAGCGGRRIAAVAFIGLMLLIALTGNYGFFNLLTIALAVMLLDDDFLRRLAWWRQARAGAPPATDAETAHVPGVVPGSSAARVTRGFQRARAVALGCLVFATLWISGVQTVARLFAVRNVPGWLAAPLEWAGPFRTINSYGLFAVMTKTRPEIVVEGSEDGQTWREYGFKWKPGDVRRAPGYVAPHQPRLDWQMWFAALQDVRGNPWFVNFLARLLQGEPSVLALLDANPFPEQPPRFVRARLYEYHFTDFATRRRTGEWWRRELKGEYCPALSLTAPARPPGP